MKKSVIVLCCISFFAVLPQALAQSQALDGQIEGTVLDQNNAAVANAEITATNIESGATRSVRTDKSGIYRFPLLPLGSYRISAQAINFKKFTREGIVLGAGQTATINIGLQAGDINETVTVSADSSIADAGKTDLSRVMTTREVQNLPLISRNPNNFGLLQTNVTGRPSRGFQSLNINVNGFLRRVNFQLDGNGNTIFNNRFRLFTMSEVMVSEVQLVTNGFAAEFGDTPGMIMNFVTPTGTNNVRGVVSYRFRTPSFYSRPFFYPSAEDIPDNQANIFTASIGAPIVKDRWHFYFGLESQSRDDRSSAGRLLTITSIDRDDLIASGLSPSIFPPAIPATERGQFYLFRTDLQVNRSNRLSTRFNFANVNIKNSIQGRFNTLERSVDSRSTEHGVAVQLTSYTPKFFNEFRFQFAQRRSGTLPNEFSGARPSITIPQVANFGSPFNVNEILPRFRVTQFQNNLTRTFKDHVFKFGGGFSLHDYHERSLIYAEYIFASIADYIAASNGTDPLGYESYEESFGDPEINYKSTFLNLFVQDDWKLTPRLKINFGVRYDLYLIPKPSADSLFYASQQFNVDTNNLAPRLGVVYALREGKRSTVLRFGAGIYMDAPLLAIYRDVNQFNGNPRFFVLSFDPKEDENAPAFPNTFSGTLPTGVTLPPQDLIFTVSPDFRSLYAMHFNMQVEQALTEDLSVAAGVVITGGRNLPVYRNINPINPIRFLSDGRPVFSSAVNAQTRLDPRFNNIFMTESAGNSSYKAFALQLRQRMSGGLQFAANYTLSKATDNIPDADLEGSFSTDPTNRALDRGHSSADQRHTFTMSLVYRPQINFENKTLRYLVRNNQFGITTSANSGERFNIVCGCDLNRDGTFNQHPDRPVGIARNSGKTPAQFNLDLRYSRFFKLKERFELEFFGEAQNLFNVNRIVGFTNVSVRSITDLTTGELTAPLPDFKARNQSVSQESRQLQLGVKFLF